MPGPTRAVDALVRAGVPHTLHTYAHDPAHPSYGQEAAEALGVEPARVHKTLVAAVGDGRLVVAVVPVTGELDLKSLAAAVGSKRADMARPADAERATGYVVGAISPLGQKRRHPTIVDAGAAQWPTIFVSGGRRGLEIELRPDDLVTASSGRYARVARAS